MKDASPSQSSIRARWRNPFGVSLVTYYLVMAGVGLLIPKDILAAHPSARDFSDFMASIVPQIEQVTALNIEPDVNRFYYSVLWVTSPLLCVLVVCDLIDGKRRGYAMWHSTPRMMIKALGGVAFVVFMSSDLWWVDPELRLTHALFSSPFWRAFCGSIALAHAPAACTAAAVLWLYAWCTGRISSRDDSREVP